MAARAAITKSGVVVRVVRTSVAIKAIDEAAKGLREIFSAEGPLAEAAGWMATTMGRTVIRVYNGCGSSITVWIAKESIADTEDGQIEPAGCGNWGRGSGEYTLQVRGAITFDGRIKMGASNCMVTATPDGLSVENAELFTD
mmetsp:Transcript_22426/g.45186  ORF Transcript_22426/g.45186 Transcript_22426/m.45186 type:complete len:142 (-) Transcript_22426:353-778(-)